MYVITINEETCKGCSECVETCPSGILELKDGKAVVAGNQDDCLGCEACVSVCETNSITVTEM
jgi:NAD-dependent dihydropyrimidine dehydrogenase PreA subunit